jgi:hypothetical protein
VENIGDVFISLAFPTVSKAGPTFATIFLLRLVENLAHLVFQLDVWFKFRIWIKGKFKHDQVRLYRAGKQQQRLQGACARGQALCMSAEAMMCHRNVAMSNGLHSSDVALARLMMCWLVLVTHFDPRLRTGRSGGDGRPRVC